MYYFSVKYQSSTLNSHRKEEMRMKYTNKYKILQHSLISSFIRQYKHWANSLRYRTRKSQQNDWSCIDAVVLIDDTLCIY